MFKTLLHFYLKDTNTTLFIEFKDLPTKKTLEIIEHIIPNSNRRFIISFKTKILNFVKNAIQEGIFQHQEHSLFKVYRMFLFINRNFLPDVYFSNRLFQWHLRRRDPNKLFGVWTVDNSQHMETAIKNKVDFITTNDPELCLFMKNRTMPYQPL